MQCNNCGTQNPSDAAFCEECGAPMTAVPGTGTAAPPTKPYLPPRTNCARCGSPLDKDASFCEECGTPVTAGTTRASTTGAARYRGIPAVSPAQARREIQKNRRAAAEAARAKKREAASLRRKRKIQGLRLRIVGLSTVTKIVVAAVILLVVAGATVGVLTATGVIFTGPMFSADDLPMQTGLEYTYYNATDEATEGRGSPVSVSFTLEGPWDFVEAPTSSEITVSYVDPKAQEASSEFPSADTCRRMGNNYKYFVKSSESVRILGEDYPGEYYAEGVRMLTEYSPPRTTYRFPFRVGDRWESVSDQIAVDYPSASLHYHVTTKVISRNSIKVPAGQFATCYLLQVKEDDVLVDGTSIHRFHYAWVVPNVGRVAFIEGYEDETQEVFSQAAGYTVLKELPK